MKGVQDEAAPSPLVPSPFITDHDPFEQMAATVTAAEHFRRRQGRGGARRMISSLSLFWICRNARAGCKRKTIL
jgi:hypothetical protein